MKATFRELLIASSGDTNPDRLIFLEEGNWLEYKKAVLCGAKVLSHVSPRVPFTHAGMLTSDCDCGVVQPAKMQNVLPSLYDTMICAVFVLSL